jgi:hypothetical protein
MRRLFETIEHRLTRLPESTRMPNDYSQMIHQVHETVFEGTKSQPLFTAEGFIETALMKTGRLVMVYCAKSRKTTAAVDWGRQLLRLLTSSGSPKSDA